MSNTEEMLAKLRKQSTKAGERLKEILQAAQADSKRSLTDDESTEFDTLVAQQEKRDTQITALSKQLDREKQADAAIERIGTGGAVVTREEGPYTATSSFNHGPSYFRDLWSAKRGDADASARLHRNTAHRNAYVDRAISTVTGAGGEFVPPLWLENEFVPLVRPGRVTANLCTQDALPPGTDSINIPKVNTGTAVALQGYPQGGQNQAIQQTDLTTTSISSGVFTVAGGQTVSMQLIEQSPLNIDRVILGDLAKAYAVQLDQFVLNGSGTNQPTGILQLAGTNAVTYTDATPALLGSGKLYSKLADAIQRIQTTRFQPPTHVLMHPRRWAWLTAQADTQNRPVVLPSSMQPHNIAASIDSLQSQGVVGQVLGLPVVVDPNLPTNLGGGTNQDVVVVAKMDDLWLWEGSVKAEAFEQTYAQQVSLFIRLYNYMSFQPGRYPQSISTVNGTGLTPPTF